MARLARVVAVGVAHHVTQRGNARQYVLTNMQSSCGTGATGCTAPGSPLTSYAYTLGLAGNRKNVAELGGRSVTYGYDNDYRLTSEAITGDASQNGTISYTYDPVGNRTQRNSTVPALPGTGTLTYDANDQTSSDPYDASGNLTNSGTGTNTWDFENRLIQDGNVVIVYDGDGNRVSETVAGVTTKYLVDTMNPTGYAQVVDELVNGSVTRTYAYGLQRVSENQLIGGVWTPSFYGYDGHGSVRYLSNANASVTDTYEYDAFGNLLASTGSTPNNYLFAGEQFDPALGVYQMRARWYREATGRFVSRDPVEGVLCCGLSWNPYIYVKDNSINAIDPRGLEAAPEFAVLDSTLFPALRAAAAELYAGAAEFAATVQTYVHVVYFTAQDVLDIILAAAHTSGVEKLIACGVVGVAVASFEADDLGITNSYEKWAIGLAASATCNIFYPAPGLPRLPPPKQ